MVLSASAGLLPLAACGNNAPTRASTAASSPPPATAAPTTPNGAPRIQPGGPKILVGGGGEQRTLRIAAKHADMTHWFPLGMDVLRRKDEVLVRHCEEIGRDPSTIERTMATPVLLAANEQEAKATLEAVLPERRPFVKIGTPEQAAEVLAPYIDAGFTGFTFNDNVVDTPEKIGLAGELLRLVNTGRVAVPVGRA